MKHPKYQVDPQTSETGTAPIRILEGKFVDFVYRYGEIKVGTTENENGDLPLIYDYVLLEAPESFETKDEDADHKEFEQVIGDVLYDIIVNESGRIGNDNRNNDTEQSS